jgi:MYXO-CTERM domain-containing protein
VLPPRLLMLAIVLGAPVALAQVSEPPPTGQRLVRYRFIPTARAQMALWIESADGARLATVKLTEATALRGIGNRPGAGQMNSGYRWPYGRREGVLPVWAHRRAAAPGAMTFPRVIFQDRTSEGFASRTSADSSLDAYFCLSFAEATTRKDGLDAVTCASAFSGDKGRLLLAGDLQRGYGEPWEEAGAGISRPLPATSLYPPRVDVAACAPSPTCVDHPDVQMFATVARTVMPELDAVSMATPPGETTQTVSFEVPPAWPDGEHWAFLEINTEGDYNAASNATTHPTPTKPQGSWDTWSQQYGYPFRGQPSVVFRVAVFVGADDSASTRAALGYGSLDGTGPQGGAIHPIDATISDDPDDSPGSGVDRLRVMQGDVRLVVESRIVAPLPDGGARPGPDGAAPDGGGGDPDAAGSDAGPGDPDASPADAGSPPPDAAGQPEPLCIAGRTVACACPGGKQGAQTCASDRMRYEPCRCPGSGGCGCGLEPTPRRPAIGLGAMALATLVLLVGLRRGTRR